MQAAFLFYPAEVYDFDSSLENDESVMSSRVPSMLVRWTTLEERLMVATWVREAFGLEADTIDDETFVRICRETESYDYLIERLLKRGQLEEGLVEAQQVDNYDILEIADILGEQGHEAAAEHLIEERVKKSSDTQETSPRPAGSPDLLMNQGYACLEGFF